MGQIFGATTLIDAYDILETQDVDLSAIGVNRLGDMEIEVVDPVSDYADMIERLFDFGKIREMFAAGFTMRFDAMHAVTGPPLCT